MTASFATLLVMRNLRWAQEVIPLQQPQGLREPRQKEDVAKGSKLSSYSPEHSSWLCLHSFLA